MPEVFPPHYTLSTKILLDYLKSLDLKDKTLLELGCGSGIISLYSASKNAVVTASDINEIAIEALNESALKNSLDLNIIHSDLFDRITNQNFDFIIINPPYYPKRPKNVKEQAWFCGEDFQYFKKLFQQLSKRQDKAVLMILSEDCDIKTIKAIATQNKLELNLKEKYTKFAEYNFIYKVSKK